MRVVELARWRWRGDGDDGEGKKALAVAPAPAAAEAAARASEGSGSEGGDRAPVQRKRTSPAATARAVTSPMPWRDCASRAAAKQPTGGVTSEVRPRTRMACERQRGACKFSPTFYTQSIFWRFSYASLILASFLKARSAEQSVE